MRTVSVSVNFPMIYRISCAIARLHALVSSHHFDAFLMPQAMAEIPHYFEPDSPRTLQRVVCKSAEMSGNQTQRARWLEVQGWFHPATRGMMGYAKAQYEETQVPRNGRS
jgi:hypothetical protein